MRIWQKQQQLKPNELNIHATKIEAVEILKANGVFLLKPNLTELKNTLVTETKKTVSLKKLGQNELPMQIASAPMAEPGVIDFSK